MKKTILRVAIVIAAVVLSAESNAQNKGDIAIGANLNANLGNVVNLIGYGAKVQYNITNDIRLEPSFTNYIKAGLDVPKSDVEIGSWECGINVHYLIRAKEAEIEKMPWTKKIVVYPLAGVGILNIKCSASDKNDKDNSASISKNFFGINLGLGIDLRLTDKLSLSLQSKYMFVDAKLEDYGNDGGLGRRTMASLGLIYKF